MSIPLKMVYRLNTILLNIPKVLVEIDNLMLTFIWTFKGTQVAEQYYKLSWVKLVLLDIKVIIKPH